MSWLHGSITKPYLQPKNDCNYCSISYVTFDLTINGDPNTTTMISSGVIQEMANYNAWNLEHNAGKF